jgi:hypothetical protein
VVSRRAGVGVRVMPYLVAVILGDYSFPGHRACSSINTKEA